MDREIFISRLLNAPIHLVWEVWTNPNHIKNWWGPNGFTNTIYVMDVRQDGVWDLTMHGPDGKDYKNKSVFKEVVKHKKLIYEHMTSPHFVATITFDARGDKTFLQWNMLFDSSEQFIQVAKVFKADQGLKQNVERLSTYLSGQSFTHFSKKTSASINKVVITRLIDAPRELVFQAFTDKEVMVQWWGPHGFTNSDCDMDVRPSGNWKILMDSHVFPKLWCKGIFIEIEAPHKLVFTSRGLIDDADQAGIETLNTLLLEDEKGKTKLTMYIEVTSLMEEATLAYEGMEEGWSQSFEKLNSYVSAHLKFENN
ncbi:MAG: SRPBCC family protein [Saprospiraceae bacterium]